MKAGTRFFRLSIAARLYAVVALSLAAVAALAGSAIHFSARTERAARTLRDSGYASLQEVVNLTAFFEKHRRLVEGAPAEFDRARLGASRQALEALDGEIAAAVRSEHAGATPVMKKIEKRLPELFEAARRVFFFADSFAQDKALEVVHGDYAAAADGIDALISAWRQEEIRDADLEVGGLVESARSLLLWAIASALAAAFLIGGAGLFLTRGALSRLGRITRAMRQLAGKDLTVEVPSRADADEIGEMARATEVFKDTAVDLVRRSRDLHEANARFDAALNNMSQGLAMFDAERRLIVCNRRYVEIYRVPPELTEAGTPLPQLLAQRVSSGLLDREEAESHLRKRREMAALGEAMVDRFELNDGRIIAISTQPMDGGGWVATHEDVTERERAEARIAHMARHDALTGLPNRVLFREQLETALSGARRGERLSVLCLDLDRFKAVNDTLGHPFGDALLRAVADRLLDSVRDIDCVARLGGDEFAIVQVGIQQPEQASALAQRIIESVSAPYELDGHHVVIGTSIGIALGPEDGDGPDRLLKAADLAMYRAKADGRGTFHFFKPEMDARMQARRALEIDLRNALGVGAFEVHYQPLVNLRSGRVSGLEALLRWNHPGRGAVSPGEFIPVAEEIGLIGQIGAWVLKQACMDAAGWPDELTVAVNLSPAQFARRTIVLDVVAALGASGLPARRLELEITETVMLQETEATLATLHQLRALGVRTSMDDFGTGYSSLSYLRRFPFDKIKIDRSFVGDLPGHADSVAIVRAVTGLGTSLGMTTTAEGVETRAQLDKLRAEGCTEVQGFFFSPARPAREIPALLSAIADRCEGEAGAPAKAAELRVIQGSRG